jgi:predicted nucleotidyltransferase
LVGIDIIAGLTGLYSLNVDQEMISRITKHKIAGEEVPVIPVEDNILLKAAWGRGVDLGKHDWEDVQAMMAFCPHLDWEYIQMRVQNNMDASRGPDVLKRLHRMWHN